MKLRIARRGARTVDPSDMCGRQRVDSNGEQGIAALETAILLPVLLLLLMGILEFGFAFFVDLSLINAVREGARAGVIVDDSGAVATTARDTVIEYVNDTLGGTFVAALNTDDISFDASTSQLDVRASIDDYPSLSPFQLLTEPILPARISARAVMRWESAGASP